MVDFESKSWNPKPFQPLYHDHQLPFFSLFFGGSQWKYKPNPFRGKKNSSEKQCEMV